MRAGFKPYLQFSQDGHLIAIGTGSDACAEHECGSKPMMEKLCQQVQEDNLVIRELRRRNEGRLTVREKLFGLEEMVYPNLLEMKRITKFPKELRFVKIDGETPEAFLSLTNHDVTKDDELRFRTTLNGEQDVASAWDENTFAFRVRGEKNVRALEEFYADMLEKKVVFSGMFIKNHKLGGVILGNSRHFDENIHESILAAQKEHNSNLRLKARDDTKSLYHEMYEACGNNKHFGFLWVRWANPDESELVYCLNPGYGVKADYWGPYTREQLLDWARSGCSYQLESFQKQKVA